MAQIAWNYLNDCMRLDICLRYEAHVIACAAMHMTLKKLEVQLDDQNESWWTIITDDYQDIISISDTINSLYQLKRVRIFILLLWYLCLMF